MKNNYLRSRDTRIPLNLSLVLQKGYSNKREEAAGFTLEVNMMIKLVSGSFPSLIQGDRKVVKALYIELQEMKVGRQYAIAAISKQRKNRGRWA